VLKILATTGKLLESPLNSDSPSAGLPCLYTGFIAASWFNHNQLH